MQTLSPNSIGQWKRLPISSTSTGFESHLGVKSVGSMMITSLMVILLAPLVLVTRAPELGASDESWDLKFQT